MHGRERIVVDLQIVDGERICGSCEHVPAEEAGVGADERVAAAVRPDDGGEGCPDVAIHIDVGAGGADGHEGVLHVDGGHHGRAEGAAAYEGGCG